MNDTTDEKAPSNAEENSRKTTCNEKTPVIKAPKTTIVIQKKKTNTSNDDEIPRTEVTTVSPETVKWMKLTTEKRSNINVSYRFLANFWQKICEELQKSKFSLI
ncbi:hypothetical protein C2G38_2150001 [Gigaspora rosea]|uniref:Uncharacterized protein n=1 Tax=Gigaspora rosea TaxID=44941 RepID=A0A397TWM2_9GLOM|nr:hypothetical protein C2G38_2150001 [Gigaspora rosea]